MIAPDYVLDVGWPSTSMDSGGEESGVYQIEVIGREGECPVQVIDLRRATLATVLLGQGLEACYAASNGGAWFESSAMKHQSYSAFHREPRPG